MIKFMYAYIFRGLYLHLSIEEWLCGSHMNCTNQSKAHLTYGGVTDQCQSMRTDHRLEAVRRTVLV